MVDRVNITELLQLGMQVSQLKGKAVANNLANLNTPGYRRKEVKFEDFLAKALDSSGKVNLDKVKAELFEPRTTPVDEFGNDVDLETEVGAMIKDGTRYKAYVRLLSKMYKQMDMAISGRL